MLGDPAQRRNYDFELENPIQKGEDGVFRRGEPGAAPPRPSVEVRVSVGLAELGGWEQADISTTAWSQALGAFVSADVAARLGLPLRVYLPPGSADGDVIRYTIPTLGPTGVDVDIRLVAKAHPRWKRYGDALHTTIRLPYASGISHSE